MEQCSDVVWDGLASGPTLRNSVGYCQPAILIPLRFEPVYSHDWDCMMWGVWVVPVRMMDCDNELVNLSMWDRVFDGDCEDMRILDRVMADVHCCWGKVMHEDRVQPWDRVLS